MEPETSSFPCVQYRRIPIQLVTTIEQWGGANTDARDADGWTPPPAPRT